MKWFTSNRRKWIYGIAVAALPILGTYLGIDAAMQEQWLALAAAILIVGGGAGAELARRNVNDDE